MHHFSGIGVNMAVPRRTRPSVDASMPETPRIGRRFAERRITLHLTQQAVADLAGVSRSSVQSLERGSGSIKFGSVLEIADVLGLRFKVSETAE